MRIGESRDAGHSAEGCRFVILVARFNEPVTSKLLDGAVAVLIERGAREHSIEIGWVPGSFELPLAAKTAARRPDVDAIICLGAVIRGETPHFEYVSQAAALGLLQVGLECNKPVIFGVLTTDTLEQAEERAGGCVGNKGRDAALAALDMIHLLKTLGGLAESIL